jgi:hypothetical protein
MIVVYIKIVNHLKVDKMSKTTSWIIIKKETNEILFETYNSVMLKKINKEKYKAVPIIEYLNDLNKKIKKENIKEFNKINPEYKI